MKWNWSWGGGKEEGRTTPCENDMILRKQKHLKKRRERGLEISKNQITAEGGFWRVGWKTVPGRRLRIWKKNPGNKKNQANKPPGGRLR